MRSAAAASEPCHRDHDERSKARCVLQAQPDQIKRHPGRRRQELNRDPALGSDGDPRDQTNAMVNWMPVGTGTPCRLWYEVGASEMLAPDTSNGVSRVFAQASTAISPAPFIATLVNDHWLPPMPPVAIT